VKADAAKQSVNSIAALRAHMKEKRAFAKDWDKQRLERWQHTQVRFAMKCGSSAQAHCEAVRLETVYRS
jgi:hypothetical protein